jgi:hypothetical protein
MHTNPIRWQSLVATGIVGWLIGCQAEPGFEAQPSARPIVFTAGLNALTQTGARMVLRPRALDARGSPIHGSPQMRPSHAATTWPRTRIATRT